MRPTYREPHLEWPRSKQKDEATRRKKGLGGVWNGYDQDMSHRAARFLRLSADAMRLPC